MQATVSFGVVCLLLAGGPSGFGALIEIGGPGTGHSTYPFGLERANLPSMRYQQVYDASAFGLLDESGGGWITEINFLTPISVSSTLRDVQINFSITQRGPDQLSSVFAENVGVNEMIVHGRGSLHLRGFDGFPVRIPLETPYFYDPALGHLLMDVWNYQPNSTQFCPFIDCAPGFVGTLLAGDAISAVYSFNVGEPVAIESNTGALLTIFNVTPIPEPSTWALFGLSAAIVLGVRWIRGNSKERE